MSDQIDDKEKKLETRRDFLKGALITVASVAGFLATVRYDTNDGIKTGNTQFKFGMSEANATCSYGSSCSGGGGQCSYGSSCGGGGGQCSYGSSCGGQ